MVQRKTALGVESVKETFLKLWAKSILVSTGLQLDISGPAHRIFVPKQISNPTWYVTLRRHVRRCDRILNAAVKLRNNWTWVHCRLRPGPPPCLNPSWRFTVAAH